MIRILQVGVGPLGQQMIRFLSQRQGYALMGVLDNDPAKQGLNVNEFCALPSSGRLRITNDLAPIMARKTRPAVAIVTTVSSIDRLVEQIRPLAAAGLNIVSTCEELSWPWINHRKAARRIDANCREHNVTCVGTGVNPGYLMDYLPVVLSAPCQQVEHVLVERVQDASSRRGPFQKKIGAGLAVGEFRAMVRQGIIRHVGLTESIHMIAAGLGWKLDKVTESIEPVISQKAYQTDHVKITSGQARGVEQVGLGYVGKRELIRLMFRAAIGESLSHDTVRIQGQPNIESSIAGGVNGDIATCAITLNTLASAIDAAPGLKTMLDLRPPRFCMKP